MHNSTLTTAINGCCDLISLAQSSHSRARAQHPPEPDIRNQGPPNKSSVAHFLKTTDILINGGTQSRANLNWDVIDEYAEAIRDGARFPAVVVFYDGKDFWLADGFHRYHAAESAKEIGTEAEIEVEIRQGTCRDAVLYSVGANAIHGLRRTNLDKRRAVETLLRDEEWGRWSNREIAKQCGVSYQFVNNIRASLTDNGCQSAKRQGADGRVINTANIGKRAKDIGTVERLKQKEPNPPLLEYNESDVVEIRAGANPELRPVDGYWGIITHLGIWSYSVHISLKNTTFQCKGDELDKVDENYTAEIFMVSRRINALVQRDDLSRTTIAVLETLSRQTYFDSKDLWLLEKIEELYGLKVVVPTNIVD